MDRREFTVEAALAALSGVVITISGCGGGGGGTPTSGSTPPPTPNANTPEKTAGISGNHGHLAVITSAQLVAGNSIALDIRGTADHAHTVTLSAADIVSIRGGTRVQTECTTGFNHSHAVTFNPTDPNDPTRY